MNRTTGAKVAVASGGYLIVDPPEGETELLPMSVVVDADGDYLVTDPNAARVIRIDPSQPLATNQTILSPNGISESFFKRPMATEIDDQGRLLVADAGDPDVENDGRLIEVNPAFGQQWCVSEGALLEEVTGIIRDEDGSFVFAGRSATPVVRLASSGFRIESESSEYQSAGGVAIDANRDILVVDAGDPDTLGDGRVLRLDPLESEPSIETGGVDLSDPFGIAIDAVPEPPPAFLDGDQDNDQVSDEDDNCVEVPNQGQWNSNPTVNVFGDACDADFDNNGAVGLSDFGLLSTSYGSSEGEPNFIESVDRHPYRAIGLVEFGVLSEFWGKPLGPAGSRAGFDPQGPCTDPPDPPPAP
jgi:hypothetical protein